MKNFVTLILGFLFAFSAFAIDERPVILRTFPSAGGIQLVIMPEASPNGPLGNGPVAAANEETQDVLSGLLSGTSVGQSFECIAKISKKVYTGAGTVTLVYSARDCKKL